MSYKSINYKRINFEKVKLDTYQIRKKNASEAY